MTQGEKIFAIMASFVVTVLLSWGTFAIVTNTVEWNTNAHACQARGGNLTTIDGNTACVSISYEAVAK